MKKCFGDHLAYSMCRNYGSVSPSCYLRCCSSGELGFLDVGSHVLGAIIVYRLSSSGPKQPGILPGP